MIVIYRTVALLLVLAAAPHSDACGSGGVSLDLRAKLSNNRFQVTSIGKDLQFLMIHGSGYQSARVPNVALNLVQRSENNAVLRADTGETLSIATVQDSTSLFLVKVSWTNLKSEIWDCKELNPTKVHWYGGPQQKYQYWPIEKLRFNDYSYVTKEADNCAIAERYWLTSDGIFYYISEDTPLFLNQTANNLCFVSKLGLPYSTQTTSFTYEYYVGFASDAKAAHLNAINTVMSKPSGVPDQLMANKPIWSTWAKYKAAIDENIVLEFADAILANGFTNSQLEIDDLWETCYGSLTFDTAKFSDIKTTVTTLKAKGFRVTLWIHPFINKDCSMYATAKAAGYLVKNRAGSTDTQWWNSKTGEAAYVDFTNAAAAQWFYDRLVQLQTDTGIDSFKFDAGESSWTPSDSVFTGMAEEHPMIITSEYIATVSQFGPIVEVRSGIRDQDKAIYMRMIDKDSEWSWNNGLPTLVTTLLQLNMNGYPFVLPDMIGGNGYNNHPPNEEMLVRWLQATVFMPSLQFSYLPWDYNNVTVTAICKKFTELHTSYGSLIEERFNLAVSTGAPVNPPIWWIDPTDATAQVVDDEFLLGETILAAPVLKEGAISRDVYLPVGTWKDGNSATTYTGPVWVRGYSAGLSVLPYFIKQ